MHATLARPHLALHFSKTRSPALFNSLSFHRPQNGAFSTLAALSSGHSRWSKIKHDKGAADNVKNKQRTVLAKEIQTVSRLYGPDPTSNPRLSTLLTQAKRIGFPAPRIAAAVNRGQGISASGAALEQLTLELLLPPTNVALIVECLTDNQSRTRQDVAEIMKKFGARDGSVKWMFDRLGRIEYRRGGAEEDEGMGGDSDPRLEQVEQAAGEEDILDWAIEAGAEDVEYLPSTAEAESESGDVGGGAEEPPQAPSAAVTVWTHVEDLTRVHAALGPKMAASGWQERGVAIPWRPKDDAKAEVVGDEAQRLRDFVRLLGEDLAVQDVYVNAADFEEG